MKLSDKAYTTLKWICLLAIPATTFIASVSDAVNFQYGSQVCAIVSAIGVFAGAIIKLSNDEYYKDSKSE